jgi:hypothetical protein
MKLLNLFFIILSVSYFVGCKKPIPEPHMNDYIYQSLKQELSTAESKLTDIKKEHSDFISKSKDPSLSISDVKIARAKADFALREIRKLEQKVKYWKLKLLSREDLVRSSYLASFNKGEEWNNEEEVQRFKKAKNWGKNRQPANASKKSESEKASGDHGSKNSIPESNKENSAEPTHEEASSGSEE